MGVRVSPSAPTPGPIPPRKRDGTGWGVYLYNEDAGREDGRWPLVGQRKVRAAQSEGARRKPGRRFGVDSPDRRAGNRARATATRTGGSPPG